MKYVSVLLAASCLLTAVSGQSMETRAGIDVRNRALFGGPAGSRMYYAGAELPWAVPRQRPRALVYALEAAGALGGVATCVGVFGLAFLASTSGPFPLGEVLLGTSIVGLPFASGYGTYLVGDALSEGGTLGGAILGGLAGLPIGIGVLYLSLASEMHSSFPGLVATAMLSVGPVPLGAVVGYNLSIKKTSTISSMGKRLQPPGVTFTSRELPDHSKEYGVRVQLAGVRF